MFKYLRNATQTLVGLFSKRHAANVSIQPLSFLRPWLDVFIPTCRLLTQGERTLAVYVFGDSLDIDNIHLCSSRLIIKNYAMSPNGSVYFHPDDLVDDFSVLSLELQSWLVHELTHVWQVQQGMKVVRRALLNRRYRYILKDGKTFLQYGIEQQAQMVQDWFLKSARNEPCADLKACLPF